MLGTTIDRRSASVSVSSSSILESLILYSRIVSRLIPSIASRDITTIKYLRPAASALVILASCL